MIGRAASGVMYKCTASLGLAAVTARPTVQSFLPALHSTCYYQQTVFLPLCCLQYLESVSWYGIISASRSFQRINILASLERAFCYNGLPLEFQTNVYEYFPALRHYRCCCINLRMENEATAAQESAVASGSVETTENDQAQKEALRKQEWRKFISPEAKHYSIGPRIIFVMLEGKNENSESDIAQLSQRQVEKTREEATHSNWVIAKGTWHEAERLYRDEETRRGFQKFLSTAQYHAFVMLQEWIHSKLEDKALVHGFVKSLYDDDDPAFTYEGDEAKQSHLMETDWRQLTLYQKLMADLFQVEFSPAHWVASGEKRFDIVEKCRRLAWQVRTAQRISYKFTSHSWSEGLDRCDTWTNFENSLPRMDYCPWLERDRTRSGFPRYLWHVSSKKTVDTISLAHPVKYMCISHTWGRWRQKDWVSLQRVPWKIPLNSRFDLVRLPNKLYSMKDRFLTDYVWLTYSASHNNLKTLAS